MNKKHFATLVTIVAALVLPASASAVLKDSPAGHSASCGWSTSGGFFYSPAYDEAISYYGHVVFGGHYYRAFHDYHPRYPGSNIPNGYLHDSYVYCG